jgi:hypothetical protein
MYDQPNGLGTRIAAGCTPGVSVEGGAPTTVTITIVSPPAPVF